MPPSSPLDDAPIAPEVLSFFRSIKEKPDVDAPRLIFADWLQEQGDAVTAARGEFLRLQVLRHRLLRDDPNYGLLKRREGELFTEHCWTWLGPLRDAAKIWSFERGMVQITARAERLTTPEVRAWARTGAASWVDALELDELTHNDIDSLAYSPLLANVNRLELSDNANQTASRLLFRALRIGGLRFLTHLSLARCRLARHGVDSLSRCRDLSRLTHLDLQRNRLNDDGARALAQSCHLQHVPCIHLERNRFTAEGIALLRQVFGERVHV